LLHSRSYSRRKPAVLEGKKPDGALADASVNFELTSLPLADVVGGDIAGSRPLVSYRKSD
jgi:hypothetical protein